MAKTTYKTWAPYEKVTAAMLNEQVRDNGNALWVYQYAGDMAYATASDSLTRLPIGNTDSVLTVKNGVPTWVDFMGIKVKSTNYIQSNANIELTPNNFNTNVWGNTTFHTGTENKLVVPAGAAGLYMIGACGKWGDNALYTSERRELRIKVNGAIVTYRMDAGLPGAGSYLFQETMIVQPLNVGDQITIGVVHTKSGVTEFYDPTLWLLKVR